MTGPLAHPDALRAQLAPWMRTQRHVVCMHGLRCRRILPAGGHRLPTTRSDAIASTVPPARTSKAPAGLPRVAVSPVLPGSTSRRLAAHGRRPTLPAEQANTSMPMAAPHKVTASTAEHRSFHTIFVSLMNVLTCRTRAGRSASCFSARRSASCFSSSPPYIIPESYLPGLLPSRRRDCHFADSPSASLLKHLIKREGDAAE